MNKVLKRMLLANPREKAFLYTSYVLNIVVISIFIMIATWSSDLTNDTLTEGDYQQLMAVLTSIIFVAALSILFFQWLSAVLFKALYEARQRFNLNGRLMGLSRKGLFSLYLKELILLQVLVIPLGVPLARFAYGGLALLMDLEERVLPMDRVLPAVLAFLGTTTLSLLFLLCREGRVPLIERLRPQGPGGGPGVSPRRAVLKFILGLILLAFGQSGVLPLEGTLFWWIKLLAFPSLVLCLDLLILLYSRVLGGVAGALRSDLLFLGNKLFLSHFRKVRVVALAIILSLSFFLGLQSLFKTVRYTASQVVKENIFYASSNLFDIGSYGDPPRKENYLGLSFKTELRPQMFGYVNGIDSEFQGGFANIKVDDQYNFYATKEELLAHLDSPDWNGLLFPQAQNFLSQEDIGKELLIDIDGKEVRFFVAGGYYFNRMDRIETFGSLSFLRGVLGDPRAYNTVYRLEGGNQGPAPLGQPLVSETKEEIVSKSYTKAVQGTDLVVLSALLIFFTALVLLANFLVFSARENSYNIVRLHSMGYPRWRSFLVFLTLVLLMVLLASILTLPLSFLLAQVGYNVTFGPGYLDERGILFSYSNYLKALAAVLLVALVSYGLSLRKFLFRERLLLLRDKNFI